MKLTKRELVLLYILAVLALVVGMLKLVIDPLSAAVSSLEEETATLKTQKTIMENMIESRDTTLAQAQKNRALLTQKAENFYAPMTTDVLDQLITGELHKFSLSPTSLTIDTTV